MTVILAQTLRDCSPVPEGRTDCRIFFSLPSSATRLSRAPNTEGPANRSSPADFERPAVVRGRNDPIDVWKVEMVEPNDIVLTLPADVNQLDETGFVWAYLDSALSPERVRPGAVIVAGDETEPFLALVVDVTDSSAGHPIVHLDVVGTPERLIDELRHSRILAE